MTTSHDARTPALASESQVEAMIRLLTDTSDTVIEACRKALLDHAEMSEPLLRERLATADGEEAEAVRAALVDVVGARLEAPLIDHIMNAPSLEEGSILIGRLIDASELPDALTEALDALADQVAVALDESLGGDRDPTRDPARELEVLTDVLAKQNTLTGTDPESADPWDAVLHGVTLRRHGLPLALCMTWLLVARRVGIPLEGLNMPGHFLLRQPREDGAVVIDPFHGGREVTPAECRTFLAESGYPAMEPEALAATDRDMLLRSLRNLVMIASRRRERELAARCARILDKTSAVTGA
jgi:regulator of sirC expression with transglutaminase-like and TPR domain